MRLGIVALTLVVAGLAPAAGSAQSEWLTGESRSVALEMRNPRFADDDDVSFLSSAFYLSARGDVGGVALVAELPFANAKYEGGGDASIGNLYAGVELPVAGIAAIELGLRLPTQTELGDDDASILYGYAGGIVDRYDAFSPELTIAPRAGVRFTMPATDALSVRGNVGGSYLVYAEDDFDPNLIADYGLRAVVESGATRLAAGVEGMWVTEDMTSEYLNQHIGFWVDHAFGAFRPGISFFVPIMEEDYDLTTLGLSVEYEIP